MPGPGEYRPDPTEGITRIEDLPKPKVRFQSRNYRRRPCPRCGHSSYRDRQFRRTLHDLGNPLTGRPCDSDRDLLPALLHPLPQVLQRRHDRPGRTRQSLHPTRRRHRRPPGHRGRLTVSHRQLEPLARSPRVRPLRHDPELGRGRGEKAARRIDADYLDWALSDFSGFIAADELYDGPFCILSIVDNRTFKRLTYQVLDHDPNPRPTSRRSFAASTRPCRRVD